MNRKTAVSAHLVVQLCKNIQKTRSSVNGNANHLLEIHANFIFLLGVEGSEKAIQIVALQ